MNESSNPDDLVVLIEQLRQLHIQTGRPSFGQIERISRKIHENRPGWRRLATSTVSDLLSGKSLKTRRSPDWLLIRSFVVVCHRFAVEAGLDHHLGSENDLVEDWYKRWNTVTNSGISVPVGAASVVPHRGQGGAAELPGWKSVNPPIEDELTLAMQRMLYAYGRLGARLLRKAEEGHAASAYRLAILLGCDGRTKEAEYWRAKAADRTPGAAELELHSPQLAKAARVLCNEYSDEGDIASAAIFIQAAEKSANPIQYVLDGLLARLTREREETPTAVAAIEIKKTRQKIRNQISIA